MPPLSFVCSIQRNILEFCLSLPSHIQFVRKRPWLCLQNIPRLQPLLTIFTTTVLVWVTVTSPLDYCTVLPFSLLPPWLSNNEFSTGSQSKSFTNKSQIDLSRHHCTHFPLSPRREQNQPTPQFCTPPRLASLSLPGGPDFSMHVNSGKSLLTESLYLRIDWKQTRICVVYNNHKIRYGTKEIKEWLKVFKCIHQEIAEVVALISDKELGQRG